MQTFSAIILDMDNKSTTYETPRHPIKVVATRTGLSKDVIRVWEKRYQAVSPGRTETGRRLYSESDIDHLLKLKKATTTGWRISDVAKLPPGELDSLVMTEAQITPLTSDRRDEKSETSESYLARCLEAVAELNPSRLDSLLSDASVALSIPKLLDDLVAPLLEEIGERWHRGDFRVGHEHLATSVIRRFLDNLRVSLNTTANGPTILFTTLSGQNHEMGALMASIAAASAGWKSLYLMPNLPSRDIVAAAIQLEAQAVALSMVYPANDSQIATELRFLNQQLPDKVTLIVGGNAAGSYSNVLEEINAIFLPGFNDIIEHLGESRTGSKER